MLLNNADFLITAEWPSLQCQRIQLYAKILNVFFCCSWCHYKINTQTPKLQALIKIHKIPIPIRPIINWSNSSAYKLAIYLAQILKQNIQLPSAYSIKNTLHLITNLRRLHTDKDTGMCSFDICNTYVDTPTKRIVTIIQSILNNRNI